ncbi:hypothetical protein JTE90_017826 [Oedothorax gibbosus]|uniref:Uncharacterized protein n=1 Tax=Oedothorax gibbosus TaxID=931172 RepID=A0AAV6VAS9_9ARAC|nr:hypothetical protein JTE90_017826 [Oedothorax gibbosus]
MWHVRCKRLYNVATIGLSRLVSSASKMLITGFNHFSCKMVNSKVGSLCLIMGLQRFLSPTWISLLTTTTRGRNNKILLANYYGIIIADFSHFPALNSKVGSACLIMGFPLHFSKNFHQGSLETCTSRLPVRQPRKLQSTRRRRRMSKIQDCLVTFYARGNFRNSSYEING